MTASWSDENGFTTSGVASGSFRFEDLDMPEFAIEGVEDIVATGLEDQALTLEIAHYTPEEREQFVITWALAPPVPGGNTANENQTYVIPPGSLAEDRYYIVTVTMQHTELEGVEAVESELFRTGAAPSGGEVLIEPGDAVLGEQVTASISGWSSQGTGLVWRLWTTTSVDSGRTRCSYIGDYLLD